MSMSVLILLAGGALSAHGDLPAGWRVPRAGELADPMRQASQTRHAQAVADFNADGRDDAAFLLKSEKNGDEALWVHLSQGERGYRWIELDRIGWGAKTASADLSMAIEVEPPGVVAYGCFDGSPDCNFGPESQRPKLKLSAPSLMYFRLGSAASLYFWSNSKQRFLRVWLSD